MRVKSSRAFLALCLIGLAALTTVALARPYHPPRGDRVETTQTQTHVLRKKIRHVRKYKYKSRYYARRAYRAYRLAQIRRAHARRVAQIRRVPRAVVRTVRTRPQQIEQQYVAEAVDSRFFDSRAVAARTVVKRRYTEAVPDGANTLVDEARRYVGTNPTGLARLWCARFMNYVLERTGHPGTGSDAAKSFANYGRKVFGPRVGAIAVMWRKGGGHVGIVTGVNENGDPIVISGNHNKTVAEAVYPRQRIYTYVMP